VREHWNVAVASAEAKSKLGVLTLLGLGGVPVITADGATVSIVSARAVVIPALPAASTAFTLNV
jgi:hypothetical protein